MVEDMCEYGFGLYFNGGGFFLNNNKYVMFDEWIVLVEVMY